MRLKLIIISLFIQCLSQGLFAYEVIEDVATKAGIYDIPITVYLPEKATGKMPVMFFVHGGGWNGGDDKKVPDAQIPADCEFLCDQLGIIYVGLAYRCKGNNGTFHMALKDLEASVKWFWERAEAFHADMSRIGFSGSSAGTTLSAVLAQHYTNCMVYVGREGMYNVLDLDTSLSHFPNAEAQIAFGLISREQKLEASPYHNIRKEPAEALLLHGKDDWLCHYSQSMKYSEQLKKAGGKCKLVLYDGINHTCLNIRYPEVFKNSMMEIVSLYTRGYKLENVDYKAIEAKLDKKTELFYPYQIIPGSKLQGSWKSSRFGTFIFLENGKGYFIGPEGKKTIGVKYENRDSWFSVVVDGEERERTFYLRKNDHSIYEQVTGDNRWKSRRNDYRKL